MTDVDKNILIAIFEEENPSPFALPRDPLGEPLSLDSKEIALPPKLLALTAPKSAKAPAPRPPRKLGVEKNKPVSSRRTPFFGF